MVFTELRNCHRILNEDQCWSQCWTVTSSCPALSLKHYCFIRFQVLFRGVSQSVALFAEISSLFSMFGSSVQVPDFVPWPVTTPEDLCCYSFNISAHFSFTSFDAFQGDRLGHFHVVIFLCLWRVTNTLFYHQEVLYALLRTDF